MAKTTGGNQATGTRSKEPTRKVTEARLASSARKASAASVAPAARKKSSTTSAVRADPVGAAKAVSPAVKGSGVRSAREAAAAQDNATVRESPVSTVLPAVVHQPRVETTAGTANPMTKKLNEVTVDDDATQAEDTPAAAPGKVEKVKARDRRAKEKALLKDAFASSQPGTLEELEERRSKLRALIKLGKERGFLTYAEINDHLPDNFTETEAIEGIISTFNDMGVAVYEQAPDAETLLLNDNAPAASSDDEVEEEAEVALSTVDSEFGRTTDPVRMYMREMGTVELLTREGEIEIAKRIEDGLKHMVMAISACPTTVQQILELADKIGKDELKIDDVVDGLLDFNEELTTIAAEDTSDAEGDEEEEDPADAGAIESENLERLKVAALERFNTIRKCFVRMLAVLQKEGHKAPKYLDLQKKISAELMQIRFSARMVEKLCDSVRSEVDNIRQHERKIQDLVVHKGGMPRPEFIKQFPNHETSLRWIDREIAAHHPYSEQLAKYRQAIIEQQQKLLDLQ